MTLQQSCDGNAKFIVPEGITKIGDNAFFNCTTLIELVISDGVIHIGDNAFNNCINLISVTLPGTLKVIEDKAFYNCNKLSSVIFPGNVLTISNEAFRWTNMVNVTLSPITVYYQDSFDDNTLINGGILFNNYDELENITWSSDDEDDEDDLRVVVDMPDDIDIIPELPSDLHINRTTMTRASNLRPKTLNIGNIPRECYDPIMWDDENITSEYMSDNNNIVFLKKVGTKYKAECLSRSSIDTILKDDTGNYLFFECLHMENISSADTNQIYVSLPVFSVIYIPLEYALNILNSNHQYFLLNYMNKRVGFSVNYGVYYQVSDMISAWHCNPGSKFNVSKPVPVNIE